MKSKIPLIIDCDPGIDDAYALCYAHLSKHFDIKAVFSVAGNVPIEMTTQNAGFILSKLDRPIPLIIGASKPLVGEPIIAKYAHGANGLGGYAYEGDYTSSAHHTNPSDAYYELLSQAQEPITIAAIGPLTNLAKLLLAYPGIQSKIKDLYIMGGANHHGNYTARAEFNIAADPLAAQIVMNAGLRPHVVPLDTTEAQWFSKQDLYQLKNSDSQIANLLFNIVDAKLQFNNLEGEHPLYFHDMITLAAIVKPELFEMIETHIDVELYGEKTKGETVFDLRTTSRRQAGNAIYVSAKSTQALIDHCKEVLLHG